MSRYETIKSWVEIALALVLTAILSPMILLFMLLVRITSPGPALYSQRRVGKDGKIFTILKIRSMCVQSEPDGPRWCLVGDRRVTSVGRFLRWTHIDELPQLLNIIRGEMSLIGPRPERPEIVAELQRALPTYHRRHTVRPGLTGLAQVLQAPDVDLASVRSKLNYDLYYIDHLGPWFDFRILLATALLAFQVPYNLKARLMGYPTTRFSGVDHAAHQLNTEAIG